MNLIFHDYMNNEYALFTNKESADKFIEDYQAYWQERINYEVTEEDDYELIPIYFENPRCEDLFPGD